jgi:hypothetical protein
MKLISDIAKEKKIHKDVLNNIAHKLDLVVKKWSHDEFSIDDDSISKLLDTYNLYKLDVSFFDYGDRLKNAIQFIETAKNINDTEVLNIKIKVLLDENLTLKQKLSLFENEKAEMHNIIEKIKNYLYLKHKN